MKVVKACQGGQEIAVSQEDLALINRLARRELKTQEVYTFSVRLCDNQVDRDFERFSSQTLEELAGLFIGKSGIFDHQWSARGQAARIYKTEVIREPEQITRAGDGYCWLKGYAYMLRTEGNQDLIAEIEGGIKREVSVGCAVQRAVCSICGSDMREGGCGHQKGQTYEGKLCFASLEGGSDAYEFSFVAVPAQPAAGVVKSADQSRIGGRPLDAADLAGPTELKRLEYEAALGRIYIAELRQEAVRLGLAAGTGLERSVLEGIVDKLSREELVAVKDAYSRRVQSRYPVRTQLEYPAQPASAGEKDQAFLI